MCGQAEGGQADQGPAADLKQPLQLLLTEALEPSPADNQHHTLCGPHKKQLWALAIGNPALQEAPSSL